jgi:type III pantothenate kinase
MFVAIDIGNTNSHIGFSHNGDIFIATETIPNTSLNQTFLNRINGGKRIISAVNNVLISSTDPEIEAVIIKWSKKVFKIKPLKAGKDFAIPIVNRTDEPERVGKDRLLNAFASYKIIFPGYRPKYIIVISAGTAITFDVVSSRKEFLGGVIAPGINTLAKSLYQNCALLPLVKIPLQRRPKIIGRNTREAITAGIYFGSAGLVNNIIQELVSELKIKHSKLRIILTGNDAELIKPQIPFKSEVIPYLTLKGLIWAKTGS